MDFENLTARIACGRLAATFLPVACAALKSGASPLLFIFILWCRCDRRFVRPVLTVCIQKTDLQCGFSSLVCPPFALVGYYRTCWRCLIGFTRKKQGLSSGLALGGIITLRHIFFSIYPLKSSTFLRKRAILRTVGLVTASVNPKRTILRSAKPDLSCLSGTAVETF